jgi:NAD+ kinase
MDKMKFLLVSYIEKLNYVVEILTKYKIEIVTDPADCDFILAIGGDGTILHAGEYAIDYNKPLIGYNSGTLGFLACSNELDIICKNILNNNYFIVKHKCLCLKYNNFTKTIGYALNEFVFKSVNDTFIELHLQLMNTQECISYQADAVIFSTPTGSTAYNLGAGGSIVHPSVNCILITPVAPFSMSSRPIILPATSEIKIKYNEKFKVIKDGQVINNIDNLHNLIIKYNSNYKKYIKLVKFNNYFIRLITNKLGWGEFIKK